MIKENKNLRRLGYMSQINYLIGNKLIENLLHNFIWIKAQGKR